MDNIMGKRIQQKRIEHGYTLEELGNKVGVNKTAIRKWEQGDVINIKRENLEKLASIFDVSPAWLVGFDTGDIEHYKIKLGSVNNNKPSVSMELDPDSFIVEHVNVPDNAAQTKRLLAYANKLSAYQQLIASTMKVKPENYDTAIKMLEALSK